MKPEIVGIQLSSSRAVHRGTARLCSFDTNRSSEITPKRGHFYAFFRFYATGSGLGNRKWSESNPAHQEPSIEVQYVSVTQFFEFMEGLFSDSAHCAPLPPLVRRPWFKQ